MAFYGRHRDGIHMDRPLLSVLAVCSSSLPRLGGDYSELFVVRLLGEHTYAQFITAALGGNCSELFGSSILRRTYKYTIN